MGTHISGGENIVLKLGQRQAIPNETPNLLIVKWFTQVEIVDRVVEQQKILPRELRHPSILLIDDRMLITLNEATARTTVRELLEPREDLVQERCLHVVLALHHPCRAIRAQLASCAL